MANPLFPNYSRAQEDAIRNFRQTSLGRVVANAAASIRRGRTPRDAARQIARDLGQQESRVRYARSAGETGDFRSAAQRRAESAMLGDVTAAMGSQLGGLIGAMIRPQGTPVGSSTTIQAELAVAAALLEAFGWQVTPPARSKPTGPNERPDWLRPKNTPREFEYREQAGSGSGGGSPPPQGPRIGGTTQGGAYPENDPVMTGEMIRVQSSNVHSIGYRWNASNPAKGTLIVRFLDSSGDGGKSTTGGPTYGYYDVKPEVFQAFRQAASKGKFVWDKLRIRGTVSGHQYQYRLIGLAKSGYVPRKATMRHGPDEWYIPRTVQGRNGQTYRSALPAQLVQRLRPQNGRPTAPNRGR